MRHPYHDPHLRFTPIVNPGASDDYVNHKSDENLGEQYVSFQVRIVRIVELGILTNENVRPIRITSTRTMVSRHPMMKEVIADIAACRYTKMLISKRSW